MSLKSLVRQSLFVILMLAMNLAHADDEQLKAKITKWMKVNGIPGAAIELYSNGTTKSFYLGYADKEKRIPVTQDTIFEIASLTKIFTTLLLADEVRAGSMKLTDPVSSYVKDLPVSKKNRLNEITLENLATHTSGFPFNVPRRINSRDKLAKFFSTWKNPSPIGSHWLYSNVNMGLLGFSIEGETHKSIYALYSEKILQPLNMNSSGSMIPPSQEKNYAQGYKMDGTPAPRRNAKEWINPPNSDWIFPATGSLKSTGHDMSLFLKAALRLPGTPTWIADAMKLCQSTFVKTPRFNQGLAWVIHPDPLKNKKQLLTVRPRSGPYPASMHPANPFFNPNALMEKTGASGGFRAYIAIIPNQQTGVVLMVNRYITSAELVRMGRELALTSIPAPH